MLNVVSKFCLSDYDKGLLFGDGHVVKNHNSFMFSTTLIPLKNYMISLLNESGYRYYVKKIVFSDEKENYEDIYKFHIDINFYLDYLKDVFINLKTHLSLGFLLGYLVTKGSLFSYKDIHESYYDIRYRINLSGSCENLLLIKEFGLSLGIKFTNVIQRKDRESLGIISNSYRMYLNRRDDLSYLLNHFSILKEFDCVPAFMCKTILNFISYDKRTPRYRAKKYYKNYRLACLYLMKELQIEYKGIRGGSNSGSGSKPLYLIENGIVNKTQYIYGWENVYNKLKIIYEERYNLSSPEVLI